MMDEMHKFRSAALHMSEHDPVRYRRNLERIVDAAILDRLSGPSAYAQATSIRTHIMTILEVNGCIPTRHTCIIPSP